MNAETQGKAKATNQVSNDELTTLDCLTRRCTYSLTDKQTNEHAISLSTQINKRSAKTSPPPSVQEQFQVHRFITKSRHWSIIFAN